MGQSIGDMAKEHFNSGLDGARETQEQFPTGEWDNARVQDIVQELKGNAWAEKYSTEIAAYWAEMAHDGTGAQTMTLDEWVTDVAMWIYYGYVKG